MEEIPPLPAMRTPSPTNIDDKKMLARATGHCNLEEVKRLVIDKRVNPNYFDNQGFTPLIVAAAKANAEIIKILLNAGAIVDAQSKDGWSALMTAAYLNRKPVVELLLKANANTLLQNIHKQTARDVARNKGNFEIVSLIDNAWVDSALNLPEDDPMDELLLLIRQ